MTIRDQLERFKYSPWSRRLVPRGVRGAVATGTLLVVCVLLLVVTRRSEPPIDPAEVALVETLRSAAAARDGRRGPSIPEPAPMRSLPATKR